MDLWKKKKQKTKNEKNMSNADIFWLPLSNHIKSKGKFLQDFTSQIDSLCFLLSQPLKMSLKNPHNFYGCHSKVCMKLWWWIHFEPLKKNSTVQNVFFKCPVAPLLDPVILKLASNLAACMQCTKTSLAFIPADKDNLFKQSRASLVSNNFLYSSDLNVWCRGDVERKN